ncbi:MAG: class I SAM-dependent methyltransferase [Candidatus Kapabacteria bacterium]|nr:class I SAM-dependent methyltransferase [Candidatus Kapabacteria bacterium]
MDNKNTPDYYSQVRFEMMKYIPQSTKRMLDVGCGSGVFGNQIKQNSQCEVWGIELNESAAKIAISKLDRVLRGRVENQIDLLPDSYFDCITFNDVLEHLVDPYSVLERIKSKLVQGGVVISSIPNILYAPVMFDLIIHKDWKYQDFGILDRTHLRFFVKKSIIRMFEEAGYEIVSIDGINPIRKFIFNVINVITFYIFNQTKFPQYATVAKKS